MFCISNKCYNYLHLQFLFLASDFVISVSLSLSPPRTSSPRRKIAEARPCRKITEMCGATKKKKKKERSRKRGIFFFFTKYAAETADKKKTGERERERQCQEIPQMKERKREMFRGTQRKYSHLGRRE